MGENRALLQLDEPRPSTSFQLDGCSTDSEPLSKLFPDEPSPSRLILPTAGFCIKTLTTGPTKKKVFINVCHTDGIPPPRDITLEQLAEVWCSDESGNYRVPMSIAAPHEERDRQEATCDVYDVAVNSTFYDKVEREALFRTFLIQVAVEGIANKYQVDISVDNGVTVLKKRKSMGNIQPHRVQVRSASAYRKMIEEVSRSAVPQGSGIPQGSIVPVDGIPQGPIYSPDSPKYSLMLVPGEMGKTLVGRFRIPNYADPYVGCNDLKLQLGWDRIRIQALSLNYLIDLFIPFFIATEHAVAIFDCETDVLTVTAPVLNYDA